jgi:hypothetical protein
MAAELLLAKKTAHARVIRARQGDRSGTFCTVIALEMFLLVKVYFIGMMTEGQGWGLA